MLRLSSDSRRTDVLRSAPVSFEVRSRALQEAQQGSLRLKRCSASLKQVNWTLTDYEYKPQLHIYEGLHRLGRPFEQKAV